MIVKDEMFCSFCGLNQYEVGVLIAGPGVNICNECVGDCRGMLKDKKIKEASEEREPVNKEIVECDVNFDENSNNICIDEFNIQNREALIDIITTLGSLEKDSPKYIYIVKGYLDRLNEETQKEYGLSMKHN